jgi:DNA-directed RNA polymerase specialized sigma24 family protein
MAESSDDQLELPRELKFISTHWTTISNPSRFVTRYGAAVRAYLRALLPTHDDADDVEQEFLLQVVEKGFPTVAPGRGQFRHYLIAVVRNAAFGYLRRRSKQPSVAADLSHVADLSSIAIESAADQEWQRSWRECVLQNTWHALREHQKKTKGNQFHAVLKASVEHSEEDSTALAARVSEFSGQTLSAESFRKQLSRARVRFGELLVEEVSRTITNVTSDLLAEELRDLDLLKYVRSLLPESRQP